MRPKTFTELEHAGWMTGAADYDGEFANVTGQTFERILDSFGSLRGKRLLDVACGPGHLAAAAARRGAVAEGIDFARAMVARAASNYPGITFTEGDAQALPYEGPRFDAVSCAFGLLHMERTDAAIAEACRVLSPGGRYTFTVWRSPEQGNDLHRLILGAIQAHGTLNVALPPAPALYRFADPEECRKTLTAAGFMEATTSIIPVTWRGKTPQDVVELVYKCMVRMRMVLEAQTAEARQRIHQAILEGAERYRTAEGIAIPASALMATATRP